MTIVFYWQWLLTFNGIEVSNIDSIHNIDACTCQSSVLDCTPSKFTKIKKIFAISFNIIR